MKKTNLFLKGLFKLVFVLSFINSLLTLSYVVVDGIYNRDFDKPIFYLFIVSLIIWAIFGVIQNKIEGKKLLS